MDYRAVLQLCVVEQKVGNDAAPLDTSAFLWMAYEPHRLPPQVSAACADRANTLVISVASVWEIQTKMEVERRKAAQGSTYQSNYPVGDDSALQHLLSTQRAQGLVLRTIALRHVRGMAQLPWHHKDPFDRIILATALVDRLKLISSDSEFPAYIADGVDVWWT